MLEIQFSKLRLKNPFMNASGILGVASSTLEEVGRYAGAVVSKSCGSEERKGYANPTVVAFEGGLLNALGLPNPGIEEFGRELEQYYRACKTPVIGSVFGGSAREFAALAKRMASHGVQAIELNLSCPHAKGYGTEIGADPANVTAVSRSVKRAVKVPVFAKLTPNTDDFGALATAAKRGGADGITAINTVKAMRIDVDLRRPVLTSVYGGLSGRAILPIGVRCVHEAYAATVGKLPILGAGGIESWRDAVEYLLAGASAVQLGTVLAHSSPKIIEEFCDGLRTYVKAEGFRDVGELVGAAHKA
jgi:dihydroorotate dehydrogenase (NAD+) catalytic subunit